MKIKYSDIFVYISIILVVVACFLPAFYELGVIDADVPMATNRPLNNGWDQFEAKLSGIKSFKLLLYRK